MASRRHAYGILLLLGVALGFNGPTRAGERPPNVIVVLADDLGVAELGCTGSTRIRTPNLDRLAARGMLFTRAYSGSTVCAPSRCTLLTGLHTGHAQIRDNGEVPNLSGPPGAAGTTEIGAWREPPEPEGMWGGQRALAPGTETIARVLQRAGYATCGVGKWGLGGPGSEGVPTRQGFDTWLGYLCQRNAHNYYPRYLVRDEERLSLEGNDRGSTGAQYATDLMLEHALSFVRDNARRPFFLYYATPVPHLALQVPDDSLAEYAARWPAEDDPPYEGGKGYLPHSRPRAAYAAMVTRFDRDMGRLFDELERLGIAGDTVIFVTSDNGSTFRLGGYDPEFFRGTGGLRGHKTNLYEGGLRVPFIATWPGRIAAGSTSDAIVANWDLFPTIVALAGATTDAHTDGIDLTSVLLGGGEAPRRDHLYWEFHSGGGWQAVRQGKWKAIRRGFKNDPGAAIALYDLEADPTETTDAAGHHPDVVDALAGIMRREHAPSPVPRWNITGPSASETPNVVIIFADDLGYGDVGVYGAEPGVTPNLDRMASQGMRFTDFYVAQPVCSASRAALLTGCYPNRLGITGALGPGAARGLHPDETTLAELCKGRGYATAVFGKWHLGHQPHALPARHGFDEFYGIPYSNDMWPLHPDYVDLPPEAAERKRGYPDLPLFEGDRVVDPEVTPDDQKRFTREFTERAVAFMEAHRDEPFFAYLAHPMPHVPLFVSGGFEDRTGHGLYADVIAEIDWSVGRVLETLDRLGLAERTLVIFTSDNGPWLSYGDHAGSAVPLREGKGTTFEGGVRVPCVMRWPGTIPAESVCREPLMTIDVLPTVAALIGAELPQRPVDGRDAGALLLGKPNARSPQEAYFFYYHRNDLEAVRSGRWKLHLPHRFRSMEGRDLGSGGTPGKYDWDRRTGLELYDLANDIGERHDVAEAHPEVVARLMALVQAMREDLGDDLTETEGSGRREPLRSE